ncbi:MAG: enoyl-CoA hydratase [Steroidobacteraceae bacterium]
MSVQTSIDGRVLRIEMARPDRRNALTETMYAQMAAALAAADADAQVRAVLICSQGDVFSAGNDLEDFQRRAVERAGRAAAGAGATTSAEAEPAVLRFMRALLDLQKPVIAAVQGAAVGIGATLLLHCDLVYCSESATFRLPFVTLGLCAEFASALTLPLAAGYHLAAEKLLLGDPISASEALQMRMVNRVLPAAELQGFAARQAARFEQLPPASVRATKQLMKQAWRAQIDQALQDDYASFMRLLAGAEAQEAFRAFFEKRKPDFSRFS